MARPIPDLDPMEANEVAQDDDILIDDVSADETKRIQVGKLLGLPNVGWTATGESWSYASWAASTRIGVINVPSNATTKYMPGMRVQITQSTGGTKYGIIHAVSATTLTVFFPVGTTFNNEAITTPYYSSQKVPFGFNIDPTLWAYENIITAPITRNTPTTDWALFSGSTITIGIGKWKLSHKSNLQGAGSGGNIAAYLSLYTSTSIPAGWPFSGVHYNANTPGGIYADFYNERDINVTSQQTWGIYNKRGSTALTAITLSSNDDTPSFIRAISAYL